MEPNLKNILHDFIRPLTFSQLLALYEAWSLTYNSILIQTVREELQSLPAQL